jgi:tetratricopeptide (TPR) repeat protein
MSSSNSVWLVKSAGRILGPYSKDSVHDMLRAKEIVVLDEVAPPFKRFRYIRDHEDFVDIVEEIRKMNFGSNEDHTFTTSVAAGTQSITERMAGTQLTEEITQDLVDSMTEEIVITDLEEEPIGTTVFKSNLNTGYAPATHHSHLANESSDWTSRALWVLAVLVIVGVAGFVYYSRQQKQPGSIQANTGEIREKGLQHYYSGDYYLAMPLLLKAYSSDPYDLELASLLAPILIQNGAEGYTQAETMLNQIRPQGGDLLTRSNVIEGLLRLKRQDFQGARQVLEQAIQTDPFSWQAFTNLGIAAYLQQNYVTAKNHFDTALKIELKRSTSRGEPHLMKTQSLLELWKREKDERYLQQARAGIQSYLNEFSDYRQEALLLKAFADFALRDYKAAENTVDALIDTDPFLTDEHAKDPTVYRDTLEWSSLLNWCRALVSGMTSSSHLETLHALCLVQTDEKEIEAQEVINAAINQAPQDPLVHSVFAFVNWHLGSDMKAELLASKAIEMNQGSATKLPYIIKARICESLENFECSLEHWKQVQQRDQASVSALGGISTSYLNLKKFSQFENSFNTARKYARYYKPLLRAQVKASQEGLKVKR